MASDICPCCGQVLPDGFAKIAGRAGLSTRERELFLSVAKGQGDAVRSQRVIHDIWGGDPDGGPTDPRNVIFVTMGRANGKLARLGYAIETVRGYGYRLVIPVEASA